MAVIGARPATGIWFLDRRPRLSRPAKRSRPRTARRASALRHREMTNISSLLVAIVAAAGLALFYLTQSTHVAATGYEIESLDAELAEVRGEQQQLIWAIGRARSPAVIAERAREELRLVPIEQQSIRFARTPGATGIGSTENHH
jgi:cell division protein FtsB